ncbi:hypothetical protein NC652_034691 [Populus alba x Populus x berolinensis]|nr:hypothetical protein NC652_034691 [Populus alba x Populus x berolinensis]
MRPNWELTHCCNHEQVVFLVTVSVCAVVILALWRTVLLRPFKLVTVFLHEASHAIACKLTCGHVEGIQVHADEGGTTQTRGGIYWLILPAGYLGSSFWGMVLILASTNLLTARIAAGCFIASLLVMLLVAQNWTLRGLCIGNYMLSSQALFFSLGWFGSCKKQQKFIYFGTSFFSLVMPFGFLSLHVA